MCARFTLTSPPDAVRAHFAAVNRPNFPARYNIAPSQPIVIVRVRETGERELASVRWGLIPPYVKDLREAPMLINARAETAAHKPAFRAAMRRRRCLIPADGFYEWTGPKGRRRPFLLQARDGGLLALAGLWEAWRGPGGELIESTAILTTAANATVRPLHDRMPAIVPPEHHAAWLDGTGVTAEAAAALLGPAPDEALSATEVDARINDPKADVPGIVQPVTGSLL